MAIEGLEVENIIFPSTLQPLGSLKQLILGGAGARGLDINGTFIKFTSIGIYIEEDVVKHLAPKYKGKSGQELYQDESFFEDTLQSPFEKFVKVALLLPLTGVQYSQKVAEQIQVQNLYIDLQERSVQGFHATFKEENFPPASAIFFSVSSAGLGIAFSKDNAIIPEKPVVVIEDQAFAEAVLATIMCKDGVAPAAKLSLAERVSKWL
eukprot:c19476_g1_i1 orf=956-1579(+)